VNVAVYALDVSIVIGVPEGTWLVTVFVSPEFWVAVAAEVGSGVGAGSGVEDSVRTSPQAAAKTATPSAANPTTAYLAFPNIFLRGSQFGI
jgi:hypothetical protein